MTADGETCRICPLCQVLARWQGSPEAVHQLATTLTEVGNALIAVLAAAAMDSAAPESTSGNVHRPTGYTGSARPPRVRIEIDAWDQNANENEVARPWN